MHESLHVYETALAAIDTVAIYIYIYIGLYYHSYNSTSLISARIYWLELASQIECIGISRDRKHAVHEIFLF